MSLKALLQEESDPSFKTWMKNNVSVRGMNGFGKDDGSGMAVLGRGLYTAPLTNKSMARVYGNLHYVVGAVPKKPMTFRNMNDWEVWLGNKLIPRTMRKSEWFKSNTIEGAIQKLGYDGVVIKGREMVHYNPKNVMYFGSTEELERWYYTSKELNTL